MELEKTLIECQVPQDNTNISRDFLTIKVSLKRGEELYNQLFNKAKELSNCVSSAAANESTFSRDDNRKIIDSFGGLIAEKAWEKYINQSFGEIAFPTEFLDASKQIDIKLTNDFLIEVRSSFIRNGVKFGICNDRYNFKNIGPYSNSVKPDEIQKNIYCGVLFETKKDELLTTDRIICYLVGSSTWDMMIEIGIDTRLNARDAIALSPGNYKVVLYKYSMDINQFDAHLIDLGYTLN